MSCSVSIVHSTQRVNFEERALLREQRPIRKEIFTMDAYPSTNLHFVITVEFPGKPLTRCNVERSLLVCMTGMQMRFLMTFALLWAHRYEYSVEKRQRCHLLFS